jgi:hypothetical protein
LKIEIIVGLIAIGVIGAVFIPLAFDPAGVGGLDFIECDEEEILKFLFVNGTLNWECSVDVSTITEVQAGTFANENTDFRPHTARGINVQDPIINFGEYSIRVLEYLESGMGETSWDYLVPQDYEVGEDLEFTVYWFKEDGLNDPQEVDFYYEEVTACATDIDESTALTVTDGAEYDFIAGEKYLIFVSATFGGSATNEFVGVRVLHGNTIFTGSESHVTPTAPAIAPCSNSEDMFSYEWFTLYEPNVVTETDDINIVFENFGVGEQVFYDDITITIINLAQYTEGVDYFNDFVNTNDLLDDNFTWNTPNDPSISFTPTNSSDYLVLGTTRYGSITATNHDIQTRLNVAGAETDLPFMQTQTVVNEKLMHTFHRTINLTNTNQTLSLQSQLDDGQALNSEKRENARIFALKLTDNFIYDYFWETTSLAVSDIDYATLLANATVTSTTDGRSIFIIGGFGVEDSHKVEVRIQLDDVDTIPDQTTQSYDFDQENSQFDVNRWEKFSVESMLNGTHVIEMEASEGSNQGTFAPYRSLTAILLEKPVTPPPPVETACMEVRLMSVDEGEDLSNAILPTFGAWKEVCASTSGGADILRTFVFTFNSTENPFEAGDVGIIQLKRDPLVSASDNYIGKVFTLFGELQWVIVPP